MGDTRDYWNMLKATRDKIALLMGTDLRFSGPDVRVAGNSAMATTALLAKVLVDKGLITDNDLQMATDAAVSTDGSVWDVESVIPVIEDPPTVTNAFDVFPGEGFETGTTATDATASNTAFLAGSVGSSVLPANATTQFDSARHAVGSQSLKTFTRDGWSRAMRTDTYETTDTLYSRFYFLATAGPPATGSFIFQAELSPLTGSDGNGFGVGLNSAGWPAMFDNGVGRLAGVTPPSICNGSWWRVEAGIYGTTCECRIYTGANLFTTTATQTFTGIYNAGSVNVVNIGQPKSNLSSGQTWTTWHDNVAFSTSGWVGP